MSKIPEVGDVFKYFECKMLVVQTDKVLTKFLTLNERLITMNYLTRDVNSMSYIGKISELLNERIN